jgi:hypothetical protein
LLLVQPDVLDLPVKLSFGIVMYALAALAAIMYARRDDGA